MKVRGKLIRKVKVLNILLLISILSIDLLQTPLSHSQAALFLPQKGMCYVTWDKERFASQYSDESLRKLASLGVEYLSICTTHYQDSHNSTTIKATEKTPSKRSLTHVIKEAQKNGMKVMLKPHIDLLDKYDGTYWRADIGFSCESDWREWFREYEKLIMTYARLAEKLDVEIFCIGTELSFTTQKDDKWREVIEKVRKVYSGKIVYAANWDNFKNINFWEELDYVGIDAYFPLTYTEAPTVEDLKKAWEKWKYEIEAWQKEVDKPIIFTEIGYPSTAHAAYEPWKSAYSGSPDPELQAKCYEAFFQTVWNEPWLAGVYWWKWDTNVRAGGKHNRQFTPQNKPAQVVLEANYKASENRTVYAMAK